MNVTVELPAKHVMGENVRHLQNKEHYFSLLLLHLRTNSIEMLATSSWLLLSSNIFTLCLKVFEEEEEKQEHEEHLTTHATLQNKLQM